MNRYKVTKNLGDGSFGTVMRAQNKSTGEWVAIKKMKQKFYSWEECLKLREVASLRKLVHPNIVKLKEVIRENDELFMIFESMEGNLYDVLKGLVRPFPENTVRNIMFQTMQAVAHVHKNGYFHRDLKPENILVSGETVKLADFGLARELRARPPFTEYISTRWYRAPEVLLKSTSYSAPLDIWACGGILAELYTNRPLFPGSSDTDQLHKICSVLGTPIMADWPDGFARATEMGLRWPQFVPTRLEQLIPQSGPDGIEVMYSMLNWDPSRRSTAGRLLAQPFFEAAAKVDSTLSQYPLPNGTGGLGGKALTRPQGFQNHVTKTGGVTLPQPQRDGAFHAGGTEFGGLGGIQSSSSSGGSAKGRSPYLNLARYQPGVQQAPILPASCAASANKLGPGSRSKSLPSSGFQTGIGCEGWPGSSRFGQEWSGAHRGIAGALSACAQTH
mmetsp:Transcript_20782/g.37857  ORF Transcript_20782/g.37857 Transcript_20782/m.37857 type:complete len:445 (-) Transcript_20782:89-1423(-)